MATLPSNLYTSYYRGGEYPDVNGDWRWRFYLEEYSRDSVNNTTTLRIRHYLQLKNQPSGADAKRWICGNRINSGSYSLNQVYGMYPVPAIPAGDSELLVWTQYRTVTHNADGTKSVYLQCRGGYYTFNGDFYEWLDPTANVNYTLTTIQRYANITYFGVSNPSGVDGLTKINASWTSDVNCSAIVYSLSTDGGASWGSWSGSVGSGTSGNFTISGLNPNQNYTVRLSPQRADSGLWNEGSGGTRSITTLDIARVTNINTGFNYDVDTQLATLQVNYSNPSGGAVRFYTEYYNGSSWVYLLGRSNYVSGTSIALTDEEKNTLFALFPNTSSLQFRIGISLLDTYYHWKDGTVTVSNANPIFSNFTYEDINETTLALTGDNQSIIKGYSNLKAIITTANKAVAQKGATMDKYRLVVGEKQIDVDYNASETVELTLNAIDNNVFMVYAIDSRGNSTVVQKSPTNYFAYTKPTLNPIKVARVTPIDTHTILSYEGSFFNANFGSQSNTITATYRYRVSDSETWVTGTTTINPTITDNSYSFEDEIKGDLGALGFSVGESYIIEVTISDKLTNNTIDDETLGSGKPNIAYHKNGVAIKKPYDEIDNPIFEVGKFRIDEDGNIQQYDETLEEYVPILEYEIVDSW